jgi:MoaA/NifB/PqqE/SkfB family radical SAM enzyme
VAFVNIGFDGPRATFGRVRGDYDKAMTGVRAFLQAGLPVSLSAVVLRSTVHALPYLYQIADVLDAGKLKLILPLRKGNALGLPEREFITVDEAHDAFSRLTEVG